MNRRGEIEGFCTPQNRAGWEMVSLFVHKKAFILVLFFFWLWLCHFPSFPVHSLPSLLLSTASFAHVSHTHTNRSKDRGSDWKAPGFWRKMKCFHMRMNA